MTRLRRNLPGAHRRRGALTVEFALTVPILFAIVLGALEFSHINMVRNTIENAAYEGARHGIIPGASAADVQAEAERILNVIGVNAETVTVTPAQITNSTERVTVTVDVPLDSNGFIAPLFMRGRTMTRSITLTREKLDYIPIQGGGSDGGGGTGDDGGTDDGGGGDTNDGGGGSGWGGSGGRRR
jgi:Flp pilus assembly protein TadG